jgi:hypothetical protein
LIAFAAVILALALALALVGWAFMVIWTKGGPQPVHEIVIAIPAPQMPPAAGGRA